MFPTRRIRTPRRARSDGIKARDSDLLSRIRRLEAMIATKVDSTAFPRSLNLALPPPRTGELVEGTTESVRVVDKYAAFVQHQSNPSRFLNNTEFWSSLSNEFDGLYQLIKGSDEYEDDFDGSMDDPIERPASLQPHFLLRDPNSYNGPDPECPSKSQMAALLDFYFTNVDPVYKILHRQSSNIHMSNLKALTDPSTGRIKFRSLEAVVFAAFFAAVVSMCPEECLTHLGESKPVLVSRYQHNTETALLQGDFLNSLELVTLQALTLYIVALRSCNGSQFSWTLIGLAVRIAQNTGLHQDGDGRAFDVHEAELRRRLWWQILVLDMRACEDRGCKPLIGENFLDSVMPCNIDDGDFTLESDHLLHGKPGATDMTICLLTMEALSIGQRINFCSRNNAARKWTFEKRRKLVTDYAQRVQSAYLNNCDLENENTTVLRIISQYWVSKLNLMLCYPLQHGIPQKAQGLQTALAFLDVNRKDLCISSRLVDDIGYHIY